MENTPPRNAHIQPERPKKWNAMVSTSQNKIYYINNETKQSQWEFPEGVSIDDIGNLKQKLKENLYDECSVGGGCKFLLKNN